MKHPIDRMDRILDMARKRDALSALIATLDRCARDIRASRISKALDVTLGTNSAGAAEDTCKTAIKHLRRELGNVNRALANMRRGRPPRRID